MVFSATSHGGEAIAKPQTGSIMALQGHWLDSSQTNDSSHTGCTRLDRATLAPCHLPPCHSATLPYIRMLPTSILQYALKRARRQDYILTNTNTTTYRYLYLYQHLYLHTYSYMLILRLWMYDVCCVMCYVLCVMCYVLCCVISGIIVSTTTNQCHAELCAACSKIHIFTYPNPDYLLNNSTQQRTPAKGAVICLQCIDH